MLVFSLYFLLIQFLFFVLEFNVSNQHFSISTRKDLNDVINNE